MTHSRASSSRIPVDEVPGLPGPDPRLPGSVPEGFRAPAHRRTLHFLDAVLAATAGWQYGEAGNVKRKPRAGDLTRRVTSAPPAESGWLNDVVVVLPLLALVVLALIAGANLVTSNPHASVEGKRGAHT